MSFKTYCFVLLGNIYNGVLRAEFFDDIERFFLTLVRESEAVLINNLLFKAVEGFAVVINATLSLRKTIIMLHRIKRIYFQA